MTQETRDDGLDTATASRRGPAALITVGALLYLIGDLTLPDVFDVADAREATAIIEESPAAWDLSWLVNALGILVCALGLYAWGRGVALDHRSDRLGRAGTVVRWSAVATTAGLYLSLWNVVEDPSELGEFFGETPITPLVVVFGVIGLLGLLGVFIGAGLVLRWLPHLPWLGWILLILGPVSQVLASMFGGSAGYLLLMVLGISLLVSPPGRGDPA
jgi:hypothetical protein